jgi:uroporphyrinogen-III synthase
MRTHVCLISAQAAANLLPALDPDLKPERAILVVSNPMQKQAENLAAVLKEAGIKTEFLRLIDEHDFGRIEADILDLASPEFDTSKAHFSPTPSNGAGFRAPSRQKPRYMDC